MTLEDCARNVPKRISRLENFLRKRLSPAELSGVRYYEVCVVECKGALLLRFVVLTNDSMLLTENPPKTLLKVIRFSQIQDISLVADRGSLLTGSQGNTPFMCQHVRLLYEESGQDTSADIKGNKIAKDEGHGSLGSGGSSSSSSSDESSSRLDCVTEIPTFDCPFDDDDSAAEVEIPGFLRRLYDPFLDFPSNLGLSPSNSLILEKVKDDSILLAKDNSDAKSLESYSTTGTNNSYENGDELELNSNNEKAHKNEEEISSTDHSSLERDRQASSPWSSDSGFGANEAKDSSRPESVDSELSRRSDSSRKSILSRYFTRRSKTIKSSERPVKLFKDEKTTFKILELNFYLYQKESSLLNELHLNWNRSKVMYGLQKENIFVSIPPTASDEQSLRATEKAMMDSIQNKLLTDLTNMSPLPQLLPFLIGLEQKLESHYSLRSLFWKNPSLTGNLVKIVQSCVCPEVEEPGTDDGREEESFIQRVMAFSVLMDIFRLLFEYCGTTIWCQTTERRNISQSAHLNPSTTVTITSNLLHVLFSCPIVSMRMPGRIKILRVVFDPQSYAKLEWTNSAESKVIKALTIAHNASVAVLHEILSLIYFSPREQEKITFMTLLRKYSLEPYVKQSVTQVINLLWPSRRPLKANQCSILYRHVYVLKVLLNNLPSIRTFVRISFCEEFQ